MENYIVSARKYRPSTFDTVVGQKALTATLRNSIATDRLAHAYLFCGSRGVGKTSCARIFAKTINCEHRTPQGEACNECASCRNFNEGRSLNIVELDAASNNGVDDMRSLIDQVQVPPTDSARYRVFIIDEVHMLSNAAFNAFLKTLEEPPAYVVFILATTEKHKVIPTILSRCQIYDFSRITIQDMVDHLQYVASQEGITAEPAALNVIARKADGAMRDALSIFDQVAASSMGNVTYASTLENLNILDYQYYSRLVDSFLSVDVPAALLIYKEIRERGFDSQFFINGLASHFRDLMVASDASTLCLLEASDEARATMAAEASRCTPQFIYKAMDLCNTADLNYRTATNKQFLIELTLVKLCQLHSPSPGNSGAGEGQLRPIATAPSHSAPQQSVGQSPASMSTARPQPAAGSRPADTEPAATDAASSRPQAMQSAPAYVAAPPPPVYGAPAVSPGQRRVRGNRPGPAISINIDVHKAAESEPKPGEATPARTSEFTDEQFALAWQGVIETHPREHLLINAMRMVSPERVAAERFAVTVESEAIRDSLLQGSQLLLSELRDRLDNDLVAIDINLNKTRSSATSLTDAEVYAKMRRDHPYLNTLVEELHLSMI